jgi:hypothetical protein
MLLRVLVGVLEFAHHRPYVAVDEFRHRVDDRSFLR